MDNEILIKVAEIKKMFMDDGFIINGVFGSYTKDENNQYSDIDILYDLAQNFRDNIKVLKLLLV